MTIKTATRIAIVGVAMGLVMFLAAPFVVPMLVPELSTHQQAARIAIYYQWAEVTFGGGGILFFLVVLAMRQKEQS